jgi:ribonucleoside-diphosphate reductase alpha chain
MEQPLPPHGACLLGSFNLTKYVVLVDGVFKINYHLLKKDIPPVVRMMDNTVDRTIYPLEEQKLEALSKRRMGLGVTGVANAIEACGFPYGTDSFIGVLENIMSLIRDEVYRASTNLAIEKGAFPLFKAEEFLESGFAKTLPEDIRRDIFNCGIRNSHLLSVAPTGTISLSADNVSSGIEPVFSLGYDRTILTFEGPIVERVNDYGYRVFGVKGRTADSLSVFDHVKVLNTASRYVDSACSKTCNVGDEVTWDQFKQVYMEAWLGGSSGCTTFRASGKRYGILNASAVEDIAEEPEKEEDTFINEVEGAACYYDPLTGKKHCE